VNDQKILSDVNPSFILGLKVTYMWSSRLVSWKSLTCQNTERQAAIISSKTAMVVRVLFAGGEKTVVALWSLSLFIMFIV
jgi:hypothetical protein